MAILDEVEQTGEPVTILKCGRPAGVLAPVVHGRNRYPQDELFGTVQILGDIIEPVSGVGMPFALHPTLARDTVEVARLPLCRVLLTKDRRFPWLILVPEREAVREIHELSAADRAELIEEIARAGEVLKRLFRPDKLNVGALGNVVPQLHVHVVARFTTDPAWPGPVWGSGPAVPYPDDQLEALRDRLVAEMSG
ncbi:MAG TPA: HIT family protein [Thermoanaerobaculia bacterium]|nr:HIT family protein [Thermoanaerobaculia bacterium]